MSEDNYLVLPCFQINPNIKVKDVPTTGEEYLLSVINERKKCLTVTKCDKDFSALAVNQSVFVQELPSLKPAPLPLKPTKEWRNIQVADFSEIRMYINKLQVDESSWPKDVKKNLPDIGFSLWDQFISSTSPTVSCLINLSQLSLNNGLSFLTESLDGIPYGESISHETGAWIYAILACIKLPLLSDTISVLRDLARACAEIRYRINPDDKDAILMAAPLNIFICIISKYFEQRDLSD